MYVLWWVLGMWAEYTKKIHSRWLDAMIPTLVCRPKLCAGKIGVLSFFVEKAVDVLRKVSMKSSIKIFILSKKEFKLFNCVLLGKRISRIGKTLWIEMRLWFFLFCSNQVSFLSEMKLYTAEGKSYLELILKWSRLQEFGSMYISIFNTLVTLRTSAWGWMALCNDGLN